MGPKLASILEDIHGAAISEANKRRLSNRAVELALLDHCTNADTKCDAKIDAIELLEDALHLIAMEAGYSGCMPVPKALQWLRHRDSKAMASRVASLAKGRNLAAHPDRHLLSDLKQHFSAPRAASDDSEPDTCMEADESGPDAIGVMPDGAEVTTADASAASSTEAFAAALEVVILPDEEHDESIMAPSPGTAVHLFNLFRDDDDRCDAAVQTVPEVPKVQAAEITTQTDDSALGDLQARCDYYEAKTTGLDELVVALQAKLDTAARIAAAIGVAKLEAQLVRSVVDSNSEAAEHKKLAASTLQRADAETEVSSTYMNLISACKKDELEEDNPTNACEMGHKVESLLASNREAGKRKKKKKMASNHASGEVHAHAKLQDHEALAASYADRQQLNGLARAALASYCEKDQADIAFELFANLQQSGFIPDVPTYNALIGACEKDRKAEKAIELFDDMQLKYGLVPNAITFAALEVFCHRKHKDMRKIPIATLYAIMIACEKGQQAVPDVITDDA